MERLFSAAMAVSPVATDAEHAVALHTTTLQLSQVSCNQLKSRGIDLAHHLGYLPDGIKKGSQAALAMSIETKQNGGTIPSVNEGGLIASLQSVGALGLIKAKAVENIRRALRKKGILHDDGSHIDGDRGASQPSGAIELPQYFKATSNSQIRLHHDNEEGGFNLRMAKVMLDESISPTCRRGCRIGMSSEFEVVELSRLENVEVFRKYRRYEKGVSDVLDGHDAFSNGLFDVPQWLQELATKNGLSKSSNTVYLLHGTDVNSYRRIAREGFKTRFSLDSRPSYGRGLYFTDSACKASQYSRGDNLILVCRVVLGRAQVLHGVCRDRLFPDKGYHSAMAKKGDIIAPYDFERLHNEFIVFDDAACYPEFVIHYNLKTFEVCTHG